MPEGMTPDLILAALCIWLFGLALMARKLSLPVALGVATLKVAIPVVYFAFYAGTWTFLDDQKYQQEGAALQSMGYTPLTAITTVQGLANLGMLSGGTHILYGWWNLLGQSLFGAHYWSPVFLNVGLTFVAGFYLERMLDVLGFDSAYRRWLMLFFLIHWDVLAWSSLINLKDTLVMTLTIVGLCGLVGLSRGVTAGKLGIIGLVVFLLIWIRFYLAFVLMFSIALWLFFQWQDRRKFLFLAGIGAVSLWVFCFRHPNLSGIEPAHILIGLFRFMLTPQPWNIDPSYSFLTVPAVADWLVFGVMLAGGIALWRRGGAFRLPLIYTLLTVLFYSVVPELEGPRQRVQIIPICAWMQFHAFWMLARARSEQAAALPVLSQERLLEGA